MQQLISLIENFSLVKHPQIHLKAFITAYYYNIYNKNSYYWIILSFSILSYPTFIINHLSNQRHIFAKWNQLLRLLYHEVGISLPKQNDYISADYPIYYRFRMLRVLLFHRGLLKITWETFGVLFHLWLCFDELSHVPSLLPDNIP